MFTLLHSQMGTAKQITHFLMHFLSLLLYGKKRRDRERKKRKKKRKRRRKMEKEQQRKKSRFATDT